MKLKFAMLALATAFSFNVNAELVEFSDGDTIKSSEFNSNFTYLDTLSDMNTVFKISPSDSNLNEIKVGDQTLKMADCSQNVVYYDPSNGKSNGIETVTVEYSHLIEDGEEQCSAVKFQKDWLTPNSVISTGSDTFFATAHIDSEDSKSFNVHIDPENPGLQLVLYTDVDMYGADIPNSYRAIKEKVTNFKVEKITYE